MYGRKIDGEVLTFGVSGKLHANSLIMYDHQTDSLWSHLVGQAVVGPKKGASIEPLESVFTTWERWRERHPDTKVLSTGRPRFFSLQDAYADYYQSGETGIAPTRRNDERLYPKEFVLGVVVDGEAYAYPFSTLSQLGVVNDEPAGVPVVVIFDKESATGVVFRREMDGRVLSFRKPSVGEDAVLVLDNETGSVWDGLTGRAVKGELKGKKLEAVPVTPAFWFGWVDHYPETEIYRAEKRSRDHEEKRPRKETTGPQDQKTRSCEDLTGRP